MSQRQINDEQLSFASFLFLPDGDWKIEWMFSNLLLWEVEGHANASNTSNDHKLANVRDSNLEVSQVTGNFFVVKFWVRVEQRGPAGISLRLIPDPKTPATFLESSQSLVISSWGAWQVVLATGARSTLSSGGSSAECWG